MIRHGCKTPKLGKPADQRKALLRSLTTEVLRHGRIKTTLVRAKAVQPIVDKMITLSKGGSLHQRRQAMSYIYDKELVHLLFDNAPERYGEGERKGQCHEVQLSCKCQLGLAVQCRM